MTEINNVSPKRIVLIIWNFIMKQHCPQDLHFPHLILRNPISQQDTEISAVHTSGFWVVYT